MGANEKTKLKDRSDSHSKQWLKPFSLKEGHCPFRDHPVSPDVFPQVFRLLGFTKALEGGSLGLQPGGVHIFSLSSHTHYTVTIWLCALTPPLLTLHLAPDCENRMVPCLLHSQGLAEFFSCSS